MDYSEILNRAADLIRDTAAKAEPGPWEAERQFAHANVVYAKHDLIDSVGVAGRRLDLPRVFTGQIASRERARFEADARWIALMSPAVAGPVERILRESAIAWSDAQDSYNEARSVINPSPGELFGWWGTRNLSVDDRVQEIDKQALALARAVLGLKEDT